MLEDRTLLATYVWTGAAGGENFNWSAPNNWTVNGRVAAVAPGKNDDVQFNNPAQTDAISIVDAAFAGTIDKLTSAWAGTIRLDSNLTVNNGLTFNEGTFRGGKELILKGKNENRSIWVNGNMFGSGVTRVLGELEINTRNNDTQKVSLARILVIEERATVSWVKGNIETSGAAVISNLGTFRAEASLRGKITVAPGSVPGRFDNVEKGRVLIRGDVDIDIAFNHTSRRPVEFARRPCPDSLEDLPYAAAASARGSISAPIMPAVAP